MTFVQIAEINSLPGQHKGLNFINIETIRGMELKLGVHKGASHYENTPM